MNYKKISFFLYSLISFLSMSSLLDAMQQGRIIDQYFFHKVLSGIAFENKALCNLILLEDLDTVDVLIKAEQEKLFGKHVLSCANSDSFAIDFTALLADLKPDEQKQIFLLLLTYKKFLDFTYKEDEQDYDLKKLKEGINNEPSLAVKNMKKFLVLMSKRAGVRNQEKKILSDIQNVKPEQFNQKLYTKIAPELDSIKEIGYLKQFVDTTSLSKEELKLHRQKLAQQYRDVFPKISQGYEGIFSCLSQLFNKHPHFKRNLFIDANLPKKLILPPQNKLDIEELYRVDPKSDKSDFLPSRLKKEKKGSTQPKRKSKLKSMDKVQKEDDNKNTDVPEMKQDKPSLKVEETSECITIIDQQKKITIYKIHFDETEVCKEENLPNKGYTANVNVWFENPQEALEQQGYRNINDPLKYSPNPMTDAQKIDMHVFSKTVDNYLKYGKYYIFDTYDAILLPACYGDMTGNIINWALIEYFWNPKNKKIFHRNMIKMNPGDFFSFCMNNLSAEFLETNSILRDQLFPPLC